MKEEVLNVHQRRLRVMEECTYIKKRKGGMAYSAASHDDVTEKVRTSCVRHGLDVYPSELNSHVDGYTSSCTMLVRIVNCDNPSDFIEVPSFGIGLDKQDKGPGKAISYAYKYALLKAFNLPTGDQDDPDMAKSSDYEGIEHEKKTPKTRKKPRLNHTWTTAEKKQMFAKLQGINTEAAENIKKTKGKWDDPTWDAVAEIIERTYQ